MKDTVDQAVLLFQTAK